MFPSNTLASNPPPNSSEGVSRRRQEDVAYQGVTIAAILLVIGSVWLF